MSTIEKDAQVNDAIDRMRHAATRSVLERGARSDPYALAGPVEPPTARSIARQYLRLGFVHIVPRGLDHILFVLGLFLLGFAGLGVSMFPYVVPDSVTIWDAAAPETSQTFMLVGVAFIMPLILAYTGWAYWVFRGKVADEGYH